MIDKTKNYYYKTTLTKNHKKIDSNEYMVTFKNIPSFFRRIRKKDSGIGVKYRLVNPKDLILETPETKEATKIVSGLLKEIGKYHCNPKVESRIVYLWEKYCRDILKSDNPQRTLKDSRFKMQLYAFYTDVIGKLKAKTGRTYIFKRDKK